MNLLPPYDDVCIDPIFDTNEHAQRAVRAYEERRLQQLAQALQEEYDGTDEEEDALAP